jgi:outer membrane protein assembly factor BamB
MMIISIILILSSLIQIINFKTKSINEYVNTNQEYTNINQTIKTLYSSDVAIVNGYIYIGDYNGHIYQLNASNISQLIAVY